MPSIFMYRYGPLLLVLHALSALALCGSSVHQAVIALRAARGRYHLRLARIHGVVCLSAYVGTMVFGGLLYPRYRYFVRGLYLDRHAPWAANLFDFKENLATLGLPLAIAALLLSRDLGSYRDAPAPRQFYVFAALGTASVALFNAIAGVLCTGVRGA